MPLHPQVRELLDQAAAQPAPPLEELSPAEARESMRTQALALRKPGEPASVRDDAAQGPGGSIPIRVYTPKGEAPFPGLVWFHGGGWVLGDLDTHDALCRHLAIACRAVIASVDYRLAPEHRFPAAVEDADAATRWVSANAAALFVDPKRLAVGGDSAGGNLATVVCLRARERGGPSIRWQLLVYPITDCDLDTASYRENATGYSLTRAGMEWFWSHYIPDPAARGHPHASPLRAPDLTGLPGAYVVTAEYDPLRDEGEAYARRLTDTGVAARLQRFPGMIHGFVRRTDELDTAGVAIARIAEEMQSALPETGV
jgi:acetyl esterase